MSERVALNVDDAADALGGVSVSTVRRLVREGRLPRVPHVHRLLIPVRALEAYVNGEVAA
jgi:excisionase family DNA binding protein